MVEKWSGEAKELIRLQEVAAGAQADKLLEKLQKEMAELRDADGALKNLSRTEDHVKFLKVGSKRHSDGATAPRSIHPSIPHICSFLPHQTDHFYKVKKWTFYFKSHFFDVSKS